MQHNRSVPVDTVLPHIIYRDLLAAIAWLTANFGFTEHYRYGDPVSGAQLYLGRAVIMVNRTQPGFQSPAQLGCATQSLTIFLDDVEAHFERARAAGVTLVEDLHETVYGELQYAALDLDGHHWLFSRHARDLSPADWGASIATPLIPTP